MIRVVLADDHAILREGVVALMRAHDDIVVVGQAASSAETLAVCGATRPDVVLLDLTMPGGGMATLERLRVELPETRVLVLTMHDDRAYLRAVLAKGGAGYLLKAARASEIVDAIRRVAAGGSAIHLGDDQDRDRDVIEAAASLSKREREVLVLIARGFTNRMIADRLGIKPKTVDTYRERIREKLGLTDRAEIFAFVERAGLLVGPDDLG